ncbi:integrase [Afipia massiliensis]|uniref:Integrase n=1 Tax=Afipia massiliensis TaxID=211460 RepID=A0A840MUU9_9BRAD|nr:integrase [Afipia massiliensis]
MPDALIQLGIIKALHKGREPNEQLFPDLYRSKSNNSFGDKLGQKFGTYRKNYDEAHRKNGDNGHAFVPLYAHLRDLHSFRHSFCTEMINVGVPQAHAEALTGHTSEARSSEFANYDHGRTLAILKVAIDKRVLPVDIPRLVDAAANSPEVPTPQKCGVD